MSPQPDIPPPSSEPEPSPAPGSGRSGEAFVPGSIPGSRTPRSPPFPPSPLPKRLHLPAAKCRGKSGCSARCSIPWSPSRGQGQGQPGAPRSAARPAAAARREREGRTDGRAGGGREGGGGCCRSPSGSRGGGKWGHSLKGQCPAGGCRPDCWRGWRGGRFAPPEPSQGCRMLPGRALPRGLNRAAQPGQLLFPRRGAGRATPDLFFFP